MDDVLEVCYLLEDTALFGGVKVVLRQANLLARRGHRITILSKAPAPSWFEVEAELRQVSHFGPGMLPPAQVTVATYWTTLEPALAAASGEVVHYCQGFEGSYTHNRSDHAAIRQAYALPVPALTVAPHLSQLLAERFQRPSRVVPQPLEPFWTPSRWPRLQAPKKPRILVTSPFEIDWKGVETSLKAVLELRRLGIDAALVRLSQWPQTDAERELLEADEFHTHVPPHQAAEIVRGCDLLLAASWEQEGFGLPVLEAMASGVPVIASDIPCFADYAATAARLVPFDEPLAFARAAKELLGSSSEWRQRRKAGLEVAAGYREDIASVAAEKAMRWVAEGRWRREAEALRRVRTRLATPDLG